MNCYCDYEMPEMYLTKQPVARKSHKCFECGQVIPPGDRYEYVKGVWDGRFDTFKTCSGCVEIRDAFREMECFCWSHGGLWEDIQNQLDEADFTPGGKFAYMRLIAKHWSNKKITTF